jgi:hypothetical protein
MLGGLDGGGGGTARGSPKSEVLILSLPAGRDISSSETDPSEGVIVKAAGTRGLRDTQSIKLYSRGNIGQKDSPSVGGRGGAGLSLGIGGGGGGAGRSTITVH